MGDIHPQRNSPLESAFCKSSHFKDFGLFMVHLTLTDRQNQPNEPKRVLLIKLILTYTVIIQIYAHPGTPSVSFSVVLTAVMNFRALVGFTHGKKYMDLWIQPIGHSVITTFCCFWLMFFFPGAELKKLFDIERIDASPL